MTIWISRELPLFNFKRLDMWCAWIGLSSEKLWPFKFLESFRCSISCVPICDTPESDNRVKSYDNLNFSRASFVQFLASRSVMRLNRKSESNVMTIWISRELPLFHFGRLDMWCAWIGHSSEKLWQFEFLESFRCSISSVSICDTPESDNRVKSYDNLNFSRVSFVQFLASRFVMRLNRKSESNVMTIWISRELPLFNFRRLDLWFDWIGHSSEKLWQFEFLESFRCSISSVSICDAPESEIRVKSYDHLKFFRASVFQFLASRYVMRLNRTFELKVMTIWISRELLLFNFERLDILCSWAGHPCEKLWPFEFLVSFRSSISSVSICDAPESDIRVKSYGHLNFSRASVVQFRACRYVMCLNRTSESKVLTIWISQELLFFNFARLYMWCTWIGHSSAKLWPFKFLESFRCSISSISTYYAPELDIHLNR